MLLYEITSLPMTHATPLRPHTDIFYSLVSMAPQYQMPNLTNNTESNTRPAVNF